MSARTRRGRSTWPCWTSLALLGCGASGMVADVSPPATQAPRAGVREVVAEISSVAQADVLAAAPTATGPHRAVLRPTDSRPASLSAFEEPLRTVEGLRPARTSEEKLVAQGAAGAAAAPSAALVPKSDFAFPSDGVGQVLRERLQPLGSVPAPPMSYTAGPGHWFAVQAERLVDRRLVPFVPAPASQAPRVDASESGVVARALPVLDAPPLILSAAVPRPAPVFLPESAKLSEPSFARLLPAWMRALSRADHVPPAASADPTRDPARDTTLPRVNLPRPPVAPLADFAIPDPFVLSREAQLKSPPAEADPPQGPPGGLPRPVLGEPPAVPVQAR